MALVVVEQNLAFAELIADAFLVIEQGTTVLTARKGEVGRDRLLQYLHV
jgi:ABC-type branched-subunit amino acid transport system ATPase component